MTTKFKGKARTQGKLKAEIGIKDFYKGYIEEANLRSRTTTVDFKTYSSVLKSFHKILVNKIVVENECYKLPFKLGLLGILKFDQNFDESKKHRWAVDWKKSKEVGQIVYFENTERYKWRWDKSSVKLKGKKYYQFKASRHNSRLIAQIKQNNPRMDYYRQLAK